MSTADIARWSIDDAERRYGVNDWGNQYFHIGNDGSVRVNDPTSQHNASVSLLDVVKGLTARGLDMPVLLRVENLLEHRIQVINEAFAAAIAECGYQNHYRGVFPIKVNQQRDVIEGVARCGARYHHGLEAGSKAELLIALASLTDHDSPIVCNGFKDAEFIQLGLYAVQLGIRCFFVVENPAEIDLIIEESRALDVRPLIGVRLKLATRVDGHWQEDSGDRSIFGLSTSQLIAVVDRLKDADMLDCLQLQHAHIGSQIPNIQNVRSGVAEACRYYINLVREGAPMGYLDMGGGLAVDYDGSASNWTHSMNYRLDEYCVDMVEAIISALDAADIAHPVLITESGRATVAYSSILLFNVLDVSHSDPTAEPEADDAPPESPLSVLWNVLDGVTHRNLQESFNDAHYYREQVRELFRRGDVSLRQLAQADNRYLQIVQRIIATMPDARRIPTELQNLPDVMADIYYGNFSVFQSLPDAWAINQVFPVMPIHRLDERPDRIALIADLTCDSDGRIDRFAHPAGERTTLPLHGLQDGEDYYLGVFLVGAYQETLGDLHNLFGDTNVASIRITGQDCFDIEAEHHGDSIADVLSYVEYNPQALARQLRDVAERAVREQRLTVADRQRMLRGFHASLTGYTYFEK